MFHLTRTFKQLVYSSIIFLILNRIIHNYYKTPRGLCQKSLRVGMGMMNRGSTPRELGRANFVRRYGKRRENI